MTNLEETIKRKIRQRKTAIDNLGKGDIILDIPIDNCKDKDLIKLFEALNENLIEAKSSSFQDGYTTIASPKGIIGNIIVFNKRVIRKLLRVFLGWYISPILDKQSNYNGKIVNVSTLEKDILIKQYNELLNMKILEEQQTKTLKEILNKQQKEIDKCNHKINYLLEKENIYCDLKYLEDVNVNYFDFEDSFRGPRNIIINSQSKYVDYFRQNSGVEVLDIGCGRGEFIELMYNNGIRVRGIDSYQPFVEYCTNRGFNVQLADALTYLHSIDDCSLGGIFMGQVVEHLTSDYIVALINVAYKKLKPGCYFILETPNPETLSTYCNFYLDSGHFKPVHYLSLKYLFEKANFENVERYNNEFSKYPFELSHYDESNESKRNLEVDRLNEVIFGYRDYTLIARK